MSETKFTPGPWRFADWKRGQARIEMGVRGDGDWSYSCWMPTRDEHNASLIAAAPDLYAELDAAVAFIGRHCGCDECLERMTKARAALAAARGESNA